MDLLFSLVLIMELDGHTVHLTISIFIQIFNSESYKRHSLMGRKRILNVGNTLLHSHQSVEIFLMCTF